jgi:hypothetical protein
MTYPFVLSMNMKYASSTMKIVLTAAVLALTPAFMAQARDLPEPKQPAVPACVNSPGETGGDGSASRQSTAIGEIPCAHFLSTTTIQRKRGPQRT